MKTTGFGCRIQLIVGVLGVCVTSSATGQSTAFTYQGLLEDSAAPANGLHDFRFSLFDAAVAGTQVGTTRCIDNMSVTDGLFTVELDFGQQFTGTAARHLQIEVRDDTGRDCTDLTGFVVLGSRQRITAAPRAASALVADNASQLGGQASAFFRNATNINAGTLADARLSTNVALLGGAQTFTGAKTFSAGLDTSAFAMAPGAGAGKVLMSDAAGAGTWQSTTSVVPWSISGTNIFNTNTGNVGIGTAVPTAKLHVGGAIIAENFGDQADLLWFSSERSWVVRQESIGAATALKFQSVGGGGNKNFLIQTDGFVGVGTLSPTAKLDVRSVGGNTMLAQQNGSAGFAAALRAENNSSGGFGVQAVTLVSSGTPIAVEGFDNVNANGIGVYGFVGSPGAGTKKAIFGECFSSGHAVFSAGNFAATGTKSFRIDHPEDPENKYLLHYCPESPEVLNFYSGTALLNGAGEAVVELPAYFARINRDPRYTLTAVGAAMPDLHIAREIDSGALASGAVAQSGQPVPQCTFLIAGGAAEGKVCWRVEAIRNDAWVRQHGAPVEVEKAPQERGKYQHPELFGQLDDKAMFPGRKRGTDGRPVTSDE